MAREAANRVLSDTAEGPLAAVPQAEELRLHVAKDVSEFNERFLSQRPHDPAVIRDAALSYRKVANIQRMLNLPKDAARSYGQAIALGERVLAEFPGDFRDELNLALTLADMGEFERTDGDLHAAEQSCLHAVAIAERLLQQKPNDRRCHLARGLGLLYLAQVQTDLRKADDACRSAQDAMTIFRTLSQQLVDGPRNATLFLRALNTWGQALRQSGNAKDAEQRLLESIRNAGSLLSYLGGESMRSQKGVSAMLPNIRFARSQAELELGLLLASDPAPIPRSRSLRERHHGIVRPGQGLSQCRGIPEDARRRHPRS